MGISNLLQFLKPIIKNSHISKYKNEVIGVDIMCWIHRGLISCAYDIVTENFNDSYLNFIEKMLDIINYYEIKVIFVFDGNELPEKKKENLIRKNRRDKAKKEAQDVIKKVKNPRSNELVLKKCIQALSVSKEIIDSVINFCKKKNIEYIISPYEADAQLSYLCRMGYISCVISEDSDLLVYGCPRVLYKLKNNGECNEISLLPINDLIDWNIINEIKNPFSNTFNQFYITPIKELEKNNKTKNGEQIKNEKKNYHKIIKKYTENFYWPEELSKLKYFNIDMFLAMCILSGCDYTNDFHLSGMGIKTAFNLVYQYKNIENIFLHLISHEKWKHKIPQNLNTLDKLMNKYHEIKNAFLHHEVYDLILSENIAINKSFKSSLKNPSDLNIINKILEYSLSYIHSSERNNYLSNDSKNTNSTPKKNYEPYYEKEREKEILTASKNKDEQNQPTLCNPNISENIFQNFTSECFEYLEISPELLMNHKNIEISNNSEKKINIEDNNIGKNNSYHRTCEETPLKIKECFDKFIKHSNNYDINNSNIISESENIISKINFFENNEMNHENIYLENGENIDNKSNVTAIKDNKEAENINTKTNKRKSKIMDSFICKKTKTCFSQLCTNTEAQENISEKNIYYDTTVASNNQNKIDKEEKLNYNSKYNNCEVHFNHKINKNYNNDKNNDNGNDNIINKIRNDNIISDNKKSIKTRSARNIYENMKRNFFLFKQLNTKMETPIEYSEEKTNPKCESPIKKDEDTDINSFQENSDTKNNEGNKKCFFINEIHEDTIDEENESESKKKVKEENLYKSNEFKNENEIKEENEFKKDINVTKEKEIKNSSFVGVSESSFSPFKKRTSLRNEKGKNQLRITNFFKKIDNKQCKQSVLKSKSETYSANKNYSIPFSNTIKSTEKYINSYSPHKNELNNIQETRKKKKCENNAAQIKDIKDYFMIHITKEVNDNKLFLNNLNFKHDLLKNENIPVQEDITNSNKNELNNLIKHNEINKATINVSLDEYTINKNLNMEYKDFKENKSFKVDDNDNENKIQNEQTEKNIGNLKSTKKYSNEFSNKNENINEDKGKTNEIKLEYILQNLNYNYQPKNQKINTFDYFKEKENIPCYNPYIDNNL